MIGKTLLHYKILEELPPSSGLRRISGEGGLVPPKPYIGHIL